MSSLISAFNKHFEEFVEDILNVFPDNVDLMTAKNSLNLVKKNNPKILIKIWLAYIVIPYREHIDAGDINFFLVKDYKEDVKNAENSDKIMESINRLRTPIQQMSKDNQSKSMKYIQNLSKISILYQSQKP